MDTRSAPFLRPWNGALRHVCHTCQPSRAFRRINDFRRHCANRHNVDAICTFPGCAKTFLRVDHLRRHEETHRQGEKISNPQDKILEPLAEIEEPFRKLDSPQMQLSPYGNTDSSPSKQTAHGSTIKRPSHCLNDPVFLNKVFRPVTHTNGYDKQFRIPPQPTSLDVSRQISNPSIAGRDRFPAQFTSNDPLTTLLMAAPSLETVSTTTNSRSHNDSNTNVEKNNPVPVPFTHMGKRTSESPAPSIKVSVLSQDTGISTIVNSSISDVKVKIEVRIDIVDLYTSANLAKRSQEIELSNWDVDNCDVYNCEVAPSSLKTYRDGKAQEARGNGPIDDEMPYTDSGYDSCTPKGIIRVLEKPTTIRGDADDEDVRTVYSSATSVDPTTAQTYISSLSQHIYGSLHEHVDSVARMELHKSLPGLIKNFAIKIGYEDASQLNRDIMYFIHKRHRDIAVEVQRLLLHGNDEASEDSINVKSGGMSLSDKMNLWQKNDGVEKPDGEQAELFHGVGDPEEEFDHQLEVPKYDKAIINSAAYKWLLMNIRKEYNLQRGAAGAVFAIDNIRQTIQSSISPSIASKRITPIKHRCAFRILLAPLRSRLYSAYDAIRSKWVPKRRISDTVVITCSSDEAQATTVEEYFAHVWPTSDMAFLKYFQEALVYNNVIGPQVTLSDSTNISAETNGVYLFLTVYGLPQSVVECAEQLAWLVSAFQSPRIGSVISFKPFVTQLSVPATEPSPAILETQLCKVTGLCKKALCQEESQPWKNEHSTSGRPKHSLEEYCSLGNPSHFQYRQTQNPCVPVFDIGVIEQNDSVTQKACWHKLLGDPVVPVIVHSFPTLRRPESCPGLELPFALLQEASQSVLTSSNGSYVLKGSRIHLKMARKLQNTFYWYKVSDSSALSYKARSSMKCGANWENSVIITSADFEAGRHIVCTGELISDNRDEANSTNGDYSSTAGTSLTDGLLSMTSDSEGLGHPEQSSVGFRFFECLLRRLISAYQSEAEEANDAFCTRDAEGSNQPKGAKEASPSALGLSTSNFRRKRQREAEENSDGEDKSNSQRRKNPRMQQPSSPKGLKYLACPCWKLDSDKHRTCLFKRLRTISYVKQHLVRWHTPKFYCPTCFMVFEDFPSSDSHAVERSCQRSQAAQLEGISLDKSRALHRKSKPGPMQEQWFAIWRVLFPDRPRPLSAYVDSALSEEFCLLYEFSQRRGVEILQEQLRIDGLTPRLGITEREMQQTLLRGLDAIFERFRLGRASGSSASLHDSIEMSSEDPAPEGTSAASSADSGVGLRTQPLQNGLGAIESSTHTSSHIDGQLRPSFVHREDELVTNEELAAVSSSLRGIWRGSTRPRLGSAIMTESRLTMETSPNPPVSDTQTAQETRPLQNEILGHQFEDTTGIHDAEGSWNGTEEFSQWDTFDHLLTNLVDDPEAQASLESRPD